MSEIRAMTDIEDANIKKVKALSPSQIKVFEETCLIRNANNGRHKYEAGLYGLFLLYTGLRCGELCALRYSVVNGRFCPQSVRNFCPIVAGFNAGTYKVPACVL